MKYQDATYNATYNSMQYIMLNKCYINHYKSRVTSWYFVEECQVVLVWLWIIKLKEPVKKKKKKQWMAKIKEGITILNLNKFIYE